MASENKNENVMLTGQTAYFKKNGSMTNLGVIERPNALSAYSMTTEGYVASGSILHGTDLADTNEYIECENVMRNYLGENWQEVENERTIITNSNVIKNMLLPGETNMQSLANSIVPDPTLDYTLLDWVETKGNNYITLGTTATTGSGVVGFDLDFMPLDSFSDVNAIKYIFGKFYTNNSRNYFVLQLDSSTTHNRFYNYADQSYRDAKLIQGQRQQMSLHDKVLTFPDGTTETLSNVTSSTGTVKIGMSRTIVANGYAKVRVYGVKTYNSVGTMLRNCIPVRNNLTGQAKLFDLVSNVYMYNTGTLHGGPVKEGGNE